MIGLAWLYVEVAPLVDAAFAAGAVMFVVGGVRLLAARWPR